jgi:YD repeat-containing protein
LVAVTDSSGAQSTICYDPFGNVTARTDANGNVTSMTYDARNRISSSADGAGDTTYYVYDDDLTDGVGIEADFSPGITAAVENFNAGPGAVGSAVLVSDPLYDTTITVNDGTGRPVVRVDGNNNATVTTYDQVVDGSLAGAPGAVVATSVTDPLGHIQSQWSDGAGRTLAMVDAAGMISTTAVDSDGNAVSTRDPNGTGQDCLFDGRNRRTSCTDTKGDITAWVYDSDGDVVNATDGLLNVTTTAYDHRDRKSSTTDRVHATTTFTYDANNNLLSTTDAEGGVTAYTYDTRNLLLTESFPGTAGGTRTYTYDPGKRLHSRRDQAGVLTRYCYDQANRLVQRHYPDCLDDYLNYDAAGRMVNAISDRYNNVVDFTYDAANRLTEEGLAVVANPQQGSYIRYAVFSGYDNANRLTLLGYPDGTQVTRSYSVRNDLCSVCADGALVARRSYDNGRRLTSTAFGNGITETRTYRADNLVSTISAPGVTGFGYTYDADKRMTAETDAVLAANAQHFGYDAADRVIGWNRNLVDTQSWNLSPVGDWQQVTTNGVSATEAHNAVHELTAISGLPLTYDAKGNLTQDNTGMTLTWDVENRLASAAPSGVTATYGYDALGRRVQKTVNDLTTTYVSSGAQEVYEVDTDQGVYSPTLDVPAETGSLSLPPGAILDEPGTVRVNFQPATSAVPAGYVADTGTVYSPQSNDETYGWQADEETGTAQRNILDLPAWDTIDALQTDGQADGVWQYALPNGTYPVVIVLGDAANYNLTNNVSINGVVFDDPNPYDPAADPGYAQGKFTGFSATVAVVDGNLTITTAPGALNENIAFAEIDLGVAGRMHQWHEHLFLMQLVLPDDVLDHRVSTGVTVFVPHPLEDPSRGVALLAVHLLVRL